MSTLDTIAAVATPPGRGGVGIIRVSGKACQAIAEKILRKPLNIREATYLPFYDLAGNILDQGIAILFKGLIHLLVKTCWSYRDMVVL